MSTLYFVANEHFFLALLGQPFWAFEYTYIHLATCVLKKSLKIVLEISLEVFSWSLKVWYARNCHVYSGLHLTTRFTIMDNFPFVRHCSNGLQISPWMNGKTYSWKDEITYPFPNFNGCTVKVLEMVSIFIPHFIMDIDYLSRLVSKLNHVSKRVLWVLHSALDISQLFTPTNWPLLNYRSVILNSKQTKVFPLFRPWYLQYS